MAVRVLVVDDSPAMRKFIRRVMGLSGIEFGECWECANGEEALACLGREAVDLILTDINMPVMDGEELLRRISADERLRKIPALVVSTDSTAHRVETMVSLGAKGFITKPFSPEMLREKFEQALGVVQ